ncbi:hypothetical protein [Leclercia adecarboxylata]|nr:hypothetical protein [Leclercia adecarboxylata]
MMITGIKIASFELIYLSGKMMRQSQDIYNDIGSVLIAAAPDNAAKIIARAELSPEGDHCKCEFDYVDITSGETNWFTAGAHANAELLDLLVELRTFIVENVSSQRPSFWHACEITVDVEKLKITIDFKYGD